MMSGVVGDQLKALKEQKVLSLFSCKLTLIRGLLQRNCLPCINVVLVKLAGTGGRASSAVWDDNTSVLCLILLLLSLIPLSFPGVSVYGFCFSMQMSEATLIWPPVSSYYGNNIKTTKCLKRSTFIPASLWSSQEISIPGNRRAHRGEQLCIWKAMLAAWTKMCVYVCFSGSLAF